MQHGKIHPDWMQWIPCSVIECSRFHAAWSNGTLLNEVDIMQHDWMQWILCSMAQTIPIERSGSHAASLNAEDSMHWGAIDPDYMRWSPCSESWFSLDRCPGVGLLDQMGVLCLVFWGISILLSTVVAPIYSLTNSVLVFLFHLALFSTSCL